MDEKRITKEFLDKLQAWGKAGQRAFNIKFDRYGKGDLSVWVFDYEIMDGMHLEFDDSVENLTERIRASKKARLMRELEAS